MNAWMGGWWGYGWVGDSWVRRWIGGGMSVGKGGGEQMGA